MKHLKLIDLPEPTQTNEFRTLKVVRKDKRITDPDTMAKTIGRPAHEVLERKPPKFDEREENLIKFKNPFIKWCFTMWKQTDHNKSNSIFG